MTASVAITIVASSVVTGLLSALLGWWLGRRAERAIVRERAAAGAATAEAELGVVAATEEKRLSELSDSQIAKEFDQRFGGGG